MAKEDLDDLTKEPTAAAIKKRWDDGEDDVADAARTWWINESFLRGEQWIRWDKWDRRIVSQRPEVLRDRWTINRLRPAFNGLLGRLTGKPLRFEDKPTAADDATVAGAKLGENLLNTTHDVQNWEQIRAAAIRDTYCGGVSMIYLDWDPSDGEVLEYDEATERIVGTGEIKLCELPVTDFRLAPGVRAPGYQSPYWISGVAMPIDEAKRRYKLKQRPEPDATMGRSALQMELLRRAGRADSQSCLVLTYWQPPSGNTKGWVATVIGEKLVDGPHPWPFPFNELNFALFHQDEQKTWTGGTVLSDCIGPQFAYNCLWSASVEQAKLAGTPYLAMDTITADANEDIDDEPGHRLLYEPGSNPPSWVVPPGPGRGNLTLISELDRILDDILANHAISRGDVNVNRTPASSIAQLAEKDDTPLGRFSHNQAEGWSRIGRLILKTYEDKVSETRELRVSAGKTTIATTKWNGKMLRGQTDVTVPLEVTKPFSRVAARQSALELWDRKIITDPIRIAEMMDEDPDDWLDTLDPDVARAKRENAAIMVLEVPTPEAYDDHPKHIAEHNAFRKSAAYDKADANVRWIMEQHLKAHEVMEHEQMGQQIGRNIAIPGSANLAQADAPPLSQIPMPFAQRQALAALPAGAGMPPMPAGPPGP